MAENTDTGDEALKNPLNIESDKTSDENSAFVDQNNMITNQETENMDIHAHHLHHAPGKKLRHYLYEFLMLFLAVFCGFLAENQREHYVENKREKEYMRSLVEDLNTDIKQLETYINWKMEVNNDFDSLILIFSNHNPDDNAYQIYKLTDRTFLRLGLPEISERTIQQLKNSGGLRMIRKEDVSAEINIHYLRVNRMKSIYEIEKLIRVNLVQTRGELLNASTLFKIKDTTLNPATFKLLSKDPLLINRFVNDLLSAEQVNSGLLNQLNSTKTSSLNLKTLIQKEYHLE